VLSFVKIQLFLVIKHLQAAVTVFRLCSLLLLLLLQSEAQSGEHLES